MWCYVVLCYLCGTYPFFISIIGMNVPLKTAFTVFPKIGYAVFLFHSILKCLNFFLNFHHDFISFLLFLLLIFSFDPFYQKGYAIFLQISFICCNLFCVLICGQFWKKFQEVQIRRSICVCVCVWVNCFSSL